ncbi:MAG: FAD-binding protein, partial [Deltaproteobacteria bacterium]
TGVEGLYAAGEVTGGVHGADRPGGNNLTDTLVFGFRAGRAAAEHAMDGGLSRTGMNPPGDFGIDPSSPEDEAFMARIAEFFDSNLTIVRTKIGLEEILQFADAHRSHHNLFIQNRLMLGALLATAALTREESRGTHYREDFPRKNPAWAKRIILSRGDQGKPVVDTSA